MTELRNLSASECEALLRHSRVARLAIRDGEGAYAVPISFAYADDGIYGHAATGRKIELMRQSPQVAVLVDDIKNIATWRSVLVRGTWHELHEDAARVRCRALLLRAFDGDLWWATAGHGHRTTLADAILYRINIDEMTGMAQNQ